MEISSEARKDRSILWTSVLNSYEGAHVCSVFTIKDKFVLSVHATFGPNRRHSFDIILEIRKQPGVLYGSKGKI